MKRALSLPAAFVCALGLHLAPLAAWLALTRAAPEPEKPLLSFDNIGIVALRAQEARTAEPPPPQTAPPPPASRPPPPRPAPKPPSRRAAVPLPEPPPAAAASAAPPPEAHEAKEEESRLAQRLVDQEALAHAIKKQYVEGVQRTLNRNLRYPLAARLAGETGKAKVRFSVSPDGGVFAIALNRSSGHARLDTAALDAVRRSAPFPPSPFGETREFDIWLDFTADDAEKNAAEAPAGDASSG